MKREAFGGLAGINKSEWLKWIRVSLVAGLLMHPSPIMASGGGKGLTGFQEESAGSIVLAQSDLILSDPPGTVFTPRAPGGVARQAQPPKPAQQAQPAGPSQQARPTLAPSPRDSVRTQPNAPVLNVPQFSVTPPATSNTETRTQGNTRITDQVSPDGFRLPSRIEIQRDSPPQEVLPPNKGPGVSPQIAVPQRGQAPNFTTKDVAPQLIAPPKSTLPLGVQDTSPKVSIPQRGQIPSLTTKDAAPKTVTPRREVIPQDTSPKVVIPQRGQIPSLTTKDAAPKTVTPPKETLPSITTKDVSPKIATPSVESTPKSSESLTTKGASDNVELKTPEPQPLDVQQPAAIIEQQILDSNKAAEEAQQKAIEEAERARREAEEKARLEAAKNQRIESQDRVNGLIGRENVESILGNDVNRDANNNAAIANTRRQSQNLGNMIKQNGGLVDGIAGGGGDVMMAAMDPCLLDLEPYCEAVLDELEKEKKEQDEAWKKELEKRRKKLEKAKEQAKREAERRKKSPQRRKNAEQKRDLDDREKQLDKDRDEIEDEKKRLEDQRDKFDDDDKRLREKERNIRKGLPDPGPPPTPAGKPDPNCRSAACQDTKTKRTKVQKDRIKNLKEQTTLDKKNDKFEREYRQWRNEAEDLEKRLDQGEGLTKREHKARMARKAAEQAEQEAWELKSELETLKQNREFARKGLTDDWSEADEKRYQQLKDVNFDEQAKNFEDKAKGFEKDLLDNQGFGFEDFANLTDGDLKQIDRGLEQALANNAEAIANVGKGGDQPHKRGAATLRDKAVRGARENAYSEYEGAAKEYQEFEDKLEGIEKQISDLEEQRREGKYPKGESSSSTYKKLQKLKEEKKALFPDFESYARNQNFPLGEKVNRSVREYERTAERNRAKEFFSGLEAGSERDFNAVTDYNKSYGETIDKKGNVDPAGVKRQARQFEKTFGDIKGKEKEMGGFQQVKNNLTPQADGKPSKAQRAGMSPKDIKKNLGEVDQKIAQTNAARQKGIDTLGRQGFQGKVNDKGEFELEVVDSPFARAYVRGIKKVNEQEKSKDRVQVAQAGDASKDKAPPKLNNQGAKGHSQGTPIKGISKDRANAGQPRDSSSSNVRTSLEKTPPPSLAQKRLERGLAVIEDQVKVVEVQIAAANDANMPQLSAAFASQMDALLASKNQIARAIETTKAAKDTPPAQLQRGLTAIDNQVKIVDQQIADAKDSGIPGLTAAFSSQKGALLASRRQIATALDKYKAAEDARSMQVAKLDTKVTSDPKDAPKGKASGRDAAVDQRALADNLNDVKKVNPTDGGKTPVPGLGKMPPINQPKRVEKVAPQDVPKDIGKADQNVVLNRNDAGKKFAGVKKTDPAETRKPVDTAADNKKSAKKLTVQDSPRDKGPNDKAGSPKKTDIAKKLADVKKADPTDAKKPVLSPSGKDKPKPVETNDLRDEGAEKTATLGKKPGDKKSSLTDSVKVKDPPPAPVVKQEEKKKVKVDPFLFDEIHDTGKYQEQIENKLANIDKLLGKAPEGSREREQLEQQKKRYTGEQIKNKKVLDRLGDQVASLPPQKRKELEQLAIKRRTAPKGDETGKNKPVTPKPKPTSTPKDIEEKEILDSYIQYVGGTLISIFKNSPLAEKFLPNLLSNLVTQFGPQVADQIVDGALDSLEDRGLEPNAALFVDAILEGIANENRMTKGAKDGFVADLARAQFLASLAKDAKLRESLKLSAAGLEEVQFSLDALTNRLHKELSRKLGREINDIDRTLDTLSNLLLLQTFPQSKPPSLEPLLKQFRKQLDRALAQRDVGNLKDRMQSLNGFIGSLRQALGVLPGKEKGVKKFVLKQRLAELLADSYRGLSDSASQLEKAAMKEYEAAKDQKEREQLFKKVVKFRNDGIRAKLGESKSRLQAGQFSRAWRLVEFLDVRDAGLQLAQANVLISIADEIEAKYGFLNVDDRKALGDINDIRDKRDRALERIVDNIKDPNLIAITATKLARNLEAQGKLRDALTILDRAQDKKPDDLSLAGERARLQILNEGDKITSDAVDKIFNDLPRDLRLPAAIVALTRLTQDEGSQKALDALVKSLEKADFISDAQRPKVAVEIALAKISIISDSPQSAAKDKQLRESVKQALAKLDALDATDVDESYLKARRNALKKVLSQLDLAEKLKDAVASDQAPAEGFDGIAQQALAIGRLDIAADALKKHVAQTLSLELGLEPLKIMQELRDGIRLLDTLQMRMMDPRLTDEQRKNFQKFLDATAPQIVKDIDAYITERVQSAIATAGRVKDAGKRKERLANYRAELRLLSRLRLKTVLAGVPRDQRQKKLDELRGQAQAAVDAKIKEIKTDFAGVGMELTKDKNYVEGLRKRLAALNALRALADGIQDYAIDNAPSFAPLRSDLDTNYGFLPPASQRDFAIREAQRKLTGIGIGGSVKDLWFLRSYEGQKEYLMGLQEKFLKEKSREGTLRRNTLRNQDDPAFKDFWLDFELLKDELEYYGNRRRELVKEDNRRNPEERNQLYEKLLQHDAKTLRDIVAPSNALMELVQDITGSGKDFRQKASELEQLIVLNQKQALLDEFEAGKKAGDAQRVFRAMVTIRDASLAGELDRFVSYLHVKWYQAGPARAYNLLIGMDATQENLEGVIADTQRLHIALIRAGYNLPDALSDADQKILRKHGYLVGNDYAIPEHIKLTPTKIASEFGDLTQKGNLAAVDRILNASKLAELVATIAIPGGIAGHFGKAVTLELLAAGAVDAAATRLLAYGAGLLVEAGVFTALSRGAQTAINPEMLLNLDLWTSDALIKEYAHNLAVLGALKIFGSLGKGAKDALAAKGLTSKLGTQLDVLGSGILFGEAAVLSGLNSLLESNQITQDSYLENLVLVLALKGTGKVIEAGAKDSPLTKFNQAKIRDRLVQAGKMPKPRPETKVSQLRDAQVRYYEWLGYEVYRPAIDMLMGRFNGSWDAARYAYQNGKVSEFEMQRLFDLRKKIVDSLTKEIQNELGGEVQAFGSENLTSDYDVSFVGPKAEIAVILFNARIANRWGLARDIGGGPSGFSLDTNVYTNPRHFEIKGGTKDVMFQDGFAHLAARKYLKDAAWKEYRDWLLEKVDPKKKAELEKLLEQVEKDNMALKDAVDAKVKELEASNKDLNPEQVKIAAENALYEAALKDINTLVEKYNNASGRAKDALAQNIRNLQSKALYFAQEAYHTEAAIKHVVMSIQASGRDITPETLLADGPPKSKVPITAAEGRQSYIEQVSNMLKEINKDGDPSKLSSKAAKYFIRAFDAAKFAGIDLTSFKDLVEITYELDSNRKDINKVKEILKKKYGIDNLDQFLKDVRKANMELTAQLFGGPRDFSVATGVGKTGDSVVIALPEALKRFAADAPVEMAKAIEGAKDPAAIDLAVKDSKGMETKDRFIDPDAETKDNLPRVETDKPGDKGTNPNVETKDNLPSVNAETPGDKGLDTNTETKFDPIKPTAKKDKGLSDREAEEMVKNFEERVAREEAAFTRSEGKDVIYADPRYRHLLEGQRTEREDRSLAVTGNIRDMLTPGEKALADKAYDIAESLRFSNPVFANLNKFDILRYVHLHSGRVSPGEAPRGPSGGPALGAKDIPASLAAEAILAQGKSVKITPKQLADATGITVKEAQMTIENATAWRDRGGKVEPGEDGMASGSPRDSPPPPGSPPSKPPAPPGKGPGDFTASGGGEPDLPKQAKNILDRLVKNNDKLKGIDEVKALEYIQANLRDGLSPAQLAVEAIRVQDGRVTPKEVQSAANISDRLDAQAAVRKAYVRVQKAQRQAALEQENRDVREELERRAKAKPARDVAERRAELKRRHEVQGRRAKSPRFDLTKHQEKNGDKGGSMQKGKFVLRHHLVEGDVDTLERVMQTKDGKGYLPTQRYVRFERINKIVQDLLDGNFDWQKVKDKEDFIEIGPERQITHGHHRMVAAHIVAQLTGRPLFGPPEANPIIPDGMVTYPWAGPKPKKTSKPPPPKRNWRIRVEAGE